MKDYCVISSSVPNALPSTARPSATPSSPPIVLPAPANITEPTATVVSALDIEAFIHQMHSSSSDQLLVPSLDPQLLPTHTAPLLLFADMPSHQSRNVLDPVLGPILHLGHKFLLLIVLLPFSSLKP
ncbi:unnamed protein product, partial [Meganyctiphanes norvegica]